MAQKPSSDSKKINANLVLLDLIMPGMDGITFIEHARADSRYAGSPSSSSPPSTISKVPNPRRAAWASSNTSSKSDVPLHAPWLS